MINTIMELIESAELSSESLLLIIRELLSKLETIHNETISDRVDLSYNPEQYYNLLALVVAKEMSSSEAAFSRIQYLISEIKCKEVR